MSDDSYRVETSFFLPLHGLKSYVALIESVQVLNYLHTRASSLMSLYGLGPPCTW